MSDRRALTAYITPFALFMAGLALVQGVKALAGGSGNFFLTEPAYWIYPLQTLACAVALVIFWRDYDFGPQRPIPLAIGIGVVVFVLWISPQAFLGLPPRIDGFNPQVFADQPSLYWGTIAARMLRLVIVVPLVEEIFWRGFLQRYLVNERFSTVAFGTYTHLSFWGVAIAFTLVHNQPDWPAAFVTGALYGWIAVKTKSLLACVVAHAVTNLLLGIYILKTGQWGFW